MGKNYIKKFAQERPLTLFFIIAFLLGWPMIGLPVALSIEIAPFILLFTLIGLLGNSILISHLIGGKKEVKKLLSGIRKWRIGLKYYLFAIVLLPLTTILVASLFGGLESPESGLVTSALNYLFMTVVIGALLLNVWEETAWTGFVQKRLIQRHGLIKSSLISTIPFVGIHLPLLFQEKGFTATAGSDIAVGVGVLLLTGVFFRYLAGMLYLATGGSILAVGLLHASFNASGSLSVVSSVWPSIVAVGLLTFIFIVFSHVFKRGNLTKTIAHSA